MTCWILLLFILFILTSCVCGSFVVNVTQSSYQAEEDHSITLEWSFTTTGLALNSLNVFCELLTDVRPYFLFHVYEGVEVPESQDEHFAGRVQCDKDVLREGRVRLHVSRLRTDDSGLYRCKVITRSGTSSGACHLNVSAARDRPEPETTSSPTESRPQPESLSWGRIDFYAALGLLAVALLVIFLTITIQCVKRRNITSGIHVFKKLATRTDRSPPAPEPAPAPAPEPVPAPESAPESVPAPEPAPESAPEPVPAPESAPDPAPVTPELEPLLPVT